MFPCCARIQIVRVPFVTLNDSTVRYKYYVEERNSTGVTSYLNEGRDALCQYSYLLLIYVR